MADPNQAASIRMIIITADIAAQPAPEGLDDIWPSLAVLLQHMRCVQAQETVVQAQQRNILRDGRFILPSPFEHDGTDSCCCSWLHEDHVYYRFEVKSGEIYFWITGRLDRCYALETIWFPARSIALTVFPPDFDAAQLARFSLRFGPFAPKPTAQIRTTAVIGFPHMLHMLWNELPAYDALAAEGIPPNAAIGVRYEPFGPMEHLYPEFVGAIRPFASFPYDEENAGIAMLTALGSSSIGPNTQARVRRVAASLAKPSTRPARDAFSAAHSPIFWISVKPPPRTLADQETVLAGLITGLAASFPNAGFILNGCATPWDFPQNPNYPSWFAEYMEKASRLSARILNSIFMRLDQLLAPRVLTLNAISVCDEIVYGEIADFYICHGGSMQNKIGWIHRIPGFIHSNCGFLRKFASMPIRPVQAGPACFLASDAIIIEDELTQYTTYERARNDENYRLSSIRAMLEEVVAAYKTAAASG